MANEPRIIGIVSAKGGVGKTTTAVNLASAIVNNFGKRVLVLDTNLTTGNLGLHLGFSLPQPSINDVLSYKLTLINSIHAHDSGLHVIPSSLKLKEEYFNPLFLKRSLKNMANHYDVIILDSAPGLGKETKTAIRLSDDLIVVTNPEFSTIGTVEKTIHLAGELRTPVTGIVINRIRKKGYEPNTRDIEGCLDNKVLTSIPDDDKVHESIAARMPVTIHSPKSRASRSFVNLAAKVLDEKETLEELGFLAKLKGIFRKQ